MNSQPPQPIRTINAGNNEQGSPSKAIATTVQAINQFTTATTLNENQSSSNNASSSSELHYTGGHGSGLTNIASSSSPYQTPASSSLHNKTTPSCTVHVSYMNTSLESSQQQHFNNTSSNINNNNSNNTCETSFERFPKTCNNNSTTIASKLSSNNCDPALVSTTTMQDQYFTTTIKVENAIEHVPIMKNRSLTSLNNTSPSTPNSYSNTVQNTFVNPQVDNHSTATSQLSHPYNNSYHINSNQSSLNSPFETTTHVEYPTKQHFPTLSSINPTQTTTILTNSQQAQTPHSHHVNHHNQQKQIPNSYAARLPTQQISMNNNNIHHQHHQQSTIINNNNINNNNNRESPNSTINFNPLTMNSHQQQPHMTKSDSGGGGMSNNNNSTCVTSTNNSTSSMSSLPSPPQPIPIKTLNISQQQQLDNNSSSNMPSPTMMMTTSSFSQYNSMPMMINTNNINNNSTQQILTTTISATTCGGEQRQSNNSPTTTCGSNQINPSNSSSSLSSNGTTSVHVKSNNNNMMSTTNSTLPHQQDGYTSSTSSSSMSTKACTTMQQNDDLSISSQPERKKKRVNPPPTMNSTNGQQLPPFIPIQPHPSVHRNPPSPNMNSHYQQFAKVVPPFGGMPNAGQPPPHGMPVPFYHSFTPFPTPINTTSAIPQRMSNNTSVNAFTPSPTTPIPLASSSSSPQADAISSSSSSSDDSASNNTLIPTHSASTFPTSTPTSQYSYEIVIPGDSCSTIIKLNVGLTLDKFHDIRMKKTIFEAFIENQKTVNDGRSGISSETQKITTWRLKQVEIIKNVCLFRFKLLDDGKQSPTIELDRNGYEINGNALAKVCETGPSRLAFSLDSYGKRVSKRIHKEKLVTCPFLITLTNGTKDFVKCVCVHLCINKREKKTVITRADFDALLRDKSYMLSLITQYASTTKKKPVDEESVSSDEDEQPAKICKREPCGSAHTELRLKNGPLNMLSINNVTLRYQVAGVDPGPLYNWKVSLKGSEGEIECLVLQVSTLESESTSSFTTLSIFFELPVVSTKVSVLVVKYKNVEQSSNAAFYMVQ